MKPTVINHVDLNCSEVIWNIHPLNNTSSLKQQWAFHQPQHSFMKTNNDHLVVNCNELKQISNEPFTNLSIGFENKLRSSGFKLQWTQITCRISRESCTNVLEGVNRLHKNKTINFYQFKFHFCILNCRCKGNWKNRQMQTVGKKTTIPPTDQSNHPTLL